jgi:hypothetical protein
MKINFDKHIWEGWTVRDFIVELVPLFEQVVSNRYEFSTPQFKTKEELKKWCMDNQPYYKKHIPEVVEYFWNKIK